MADVGDGVNDLADAPDLSPANEALTVDTAHFRAVLGHFATGIVVVTGFDEIESPVLLRPTTLIGAGLQVAGWQTA